MRRLLERVRPELIINAAAYTNVDGAEEHGQLAREINAGVPEQLARYARRTGSRLVHVSTDYVFDGTTRRPYTEDDRPAPINAYGRSKLEGEQAILASGARAVILRTAWLYSARSKNFFTSMLDFCRNRELIEVVADKIGSPTTAGFLAEAIMRLCNRRFPDHPLLLHCTARGSVSRYRFVRRMVELARDSGMPLRVKHILPVGSERFPLPAPRPDCSALASRRLASMIGLTPPSIEQEIRRTLLDVARAKKMHARAS